MISRRVSVGAIQSTAAGNTAATSTSNTVKKLLDPIDDFVHMEYELAGDICSQVDTALAALKKVYIIIQSIYYIICNTLKFINL